MGELEERVAVVETRVDGIDMAIAELKPDMKLLRDSQLAIEMTLSAWKSALAVAWTAVSGLVFGAIGFAANAFARWMGWM